MTQISVRIILTEIRKGDYTMDVATRYDRAQSLREEAAGCLGMIAEVRSKTSLLIRRDDLNEWEKRASLCELESDLAKYHRQFDQTLIEMDELLEIDNGHIP